MGVAQLEELPEFIKRKNKNYSLYKELFADSPLCRLIPFRNDISSNKWFYSLEINTDIVKKSVKQIIEELARNNIQSRAIWGLINEQKPYIHEYTYRLEKSVYYASRIINLPCSTNLSDEEIRYVSDTVIRILGE